MCTYVIELLLNGRTDFDEFFLCGSLDGLDFHLDPVGGAGVGFIASQFFHGQFSQFSYFIK